MTKYNKWINIDNVTEFPEQIDNTFLITLSGDEPNIAFYKHGKFYPNNISTCRYPIQNITHWMRVKLPKTVIKK